MIYLNVIGAISTVSTSMSVIVSPNFLSGNGEMVTVTATVTNIDRTKPACPTGTVTITPPRTGSNQMVAGPVVLVPLDATAASCSLNVSVNVGSALNNIVTATYTGGILFLGWDRISLCAL